MPIEDAILERCHSLERLGMVSALVVANQVPKKVFLCYTTVERSVACQLLLRRKSNTF